MMVKTEQADRRPGYSAMVCHYFRVGLAAALIMLAPGTAAATGTVDVSDLSAITVPGEVPEHWQPHVFRSIKSATLYRLEIDTRFGPVIKADATSSASILTRKLDVDPTQYPELTWNWKISRVLPTSSLTEPDGDDFAARLLISFGEPNRQGRLPEATLCYVWAAAEDVGTMMTSPSHAGVVTIVASNNTSRAGKWQTVKRDIESDYRAAYGTEPPHIRAVSLMTDTDDTDTHISAWYGPIYLSSHTNKIP